jgi:hypothetical protein
MFAMLGNLRKTLWRGNEANGDALFHVVVNAT